MRSSHFFCRISLVLAAAGAALSASSCGPATGVEQQKYTLRQKGISRSMNAVIVTRHPLAEGYDPAELRALAAQPKKDPSRLADLISRAAAEKDPAFRDLPAREDLRHCDRYVALVLLAYDYNVNGNKSAFDILMWNLRKDRQGSNSVSVGALAVVDEWKISPDAVKKFFRHTDGAGGIEKGQFWQTREFYFPEHFDQYRAKYP